MRLARSLGYLLAYMKLEVAMVLHEKVRPTPNKPAYGPVVIHSQEGNKSNNFVGEMGRLNTDN